MSFLRFIWNRQNMYLLYFAQTFILFSSHLKWDLQIIMIYVYFINWWDHEKGLNILIRYRDYNTNFFLCKSFLFWPPIYYEDKYNHTYYTLNIHSAENKLVSNHFDNVKPAGHNKLNFYFKINICIQCPHDDKL